MEAEKFSGKSRLQYAVTLRSGERIMVAVSRKSLDAFLQVMDLNGVRDIVERDDSDTMPGENTITYDQLRKNAERYGLDFPHEYSRTVNVRNYNKKYLWRLPFNIYKESEADLYEYLYPMKGRVKYIKALIREDMKKKGISVRDEENAKKASKKSLKSI